MANELKNIPWVEKYRPDRLDGIVGDFKEKIMAYLSNPKAIPNFLLYSRTPGTGKTTLAYAISNELGCDTLVINASDDRKIEVIRDKVKQFARTKSTNGLRKLVFMDEFDGNLKLTQQALKNLMETYSNNCFYILTCNDISKVLEPIQSRCVLIEFAKPNKLQIKERLKYIAEKESLKYDDAALDKLINIYYPSIRNCINTMQDYYIANKSLILENILTTEDLFADVVALMKGGKYTEVKKKILEDAIDVDDFNKYLFSIASKFPLPIEIEIIKTLARNDFEFTQGVNKDLCFIARVPNLIKLMRKHESDQNNR